MISAYFTTVSFWFVIVVFIFIYRALKHDLSLKLDVLLVHSIISSLLISIPTFYGVYVLLNKVLL